VDDPLIVVALLLVAASASAAVATRDPSRQALVLAVLGSRTTVPRTDAKRMLISPRVSKARWSPWDHEGQPSQVP
jgi:hypothetical protein